MTTDYKQLYISMFAWPSFGHMIPFLQLANKLAERGHVINLLVPQKAKLLLEAYNLYPSHIVLLPITIPHVDPLPLGIETTSDVPFPLHTHLATAMDLARPEVESIMSGLKPKPDIILYDLAHWVADIALGLGAKSLCYYIVCAAALAHSMVPSRKLAQGRPDVPEPPPGYPSSTVVLPPNRVLYLANPFGVGLTLYDRITASLAAADAIAIRTCSEIEGKYCDYIGEQYNKPVFLTGPVLPDPDTSIELEDRWAEWLGRFGPNSVVFCSIGSQFVPSQAEFLELMLGLEMAKLPFIAAVKPPTGSASIEEALPEGFKDRVGDRGVVYDGWVQQPLILAHPSVGCFVNHCGPGTMWEGLMNDKQLVMLPQLGDQVLSTKTLSQELKLCVEVERLEDDSFTKDSLCKAIKLVMDKDSEVGALVKKNHAIWRETILGQGFMSSYIDNFIMDLQGLVNS